ncbi:hypothetical protein [Streptomyces sparsogenes]|uniref:hypothetical protein n=1 Tax=Streptomyces sparsogenes TaxID=67365 RepID=UPI00114CEAB6|nr:hypothetical protein [Streptomyces sparsogenes]
MPTKQPEPTAPQAVALTHIAKGGTYRWEHSGTWYIIAPDGTTMSKTTVNALVRRGWVEYGTLRGIKRPLTITEAGRQALPSATS